MDFNDVMERVSIVVEKNLGIKPTDKVIAKYLNITATNFANMKKRNRIPFEEIAYFSAKHKVSTNWVLFNQHCESLVSHEEKFYSLRVIDKINASCGGGAFEYETISTKKINLDKEILINLGYSSNNNLEAIKVIGDSMQPTLKDNDLILIDRSLIKYNNHSIFLVNTIDGLFVKRLNIYDENKIDLISDNEEYLNNTFCVDEVTILGKVLGVLELKDNQTEVMTGFENKAIADTKIEYNTGYIELIDGKYNFFVPNEDLQSGYDEYTDEPLFDLESNQFYAITIKCKTYDNLVNNKILELESSNSIFLPNNDYYVFLFEDSDIFMIERAKLIKA